MREVVRFETNIPVEMALEYAEGKPVEGRYGDQMYYSLEDNRCMYVELDVARQITQLRIEPGDAFTICKRERKEGRKRSIAWEVECEGKTAKAAISKVPAPAVATPRQQNTEAQSQNTVRGADAGGENLMGMRLALSASITLLAEAEVFAKSKGMALHFTGEDVRAMANCLYIQVSKSTQAPGQFFGLNETAVRQ